MKPNARPQPRARAGAKNERRLLRVGCRPLFGAGLGRDATRPSWRGQQPLPLMACPASLSVVAPHQTKTLRRRAYGRLGGQKERERDNVFRGLDPFALAKHALALRSRRPHYLGDHWPWNEFIHADILWPQFLRQHPGEHPQPSLGTRVGRAPGYAAMPDP